VTIATDEALLGRAIEVAAASLRAGRGGPFGAVIVRDGSVLAEGANEVLATNDPTAHAEVVAIRRACAAVGSFSLAGAVLYASSEPCPMCLAAIYWARLDGLVFASDRRIAADAGFDDAAFYEELARFPASGRIKIRHVPLEAGRLLFEEWKSKPDKIPY
jgi:tRNA(Arg) A34 adenosine deaminase TadA